MSDQMELSIEVMDVTPSQAQQWLSHNQENRYLSPIGVKRYAEQMRRGQWQLTHQGIAIDSEGNLLDGQHRLAAIVESGCTIKMMVTQNVPRETFMYVDNGKKRAAAQLLPKHLGNVSSLASAARYLLVVEGRAGVMTQTNNVMYDCYWSNAPTPAILDCVARWEAELVIAADIASKVYQSTGITKGAHTAVLAQMLRSDYAYQVPEWSKGLIYGAGLSPKDARLTLRDKFLRMSGNRDYQSVHRGMAYGLIVKSANLFVQNKPSQVLLMRQNESIQRVVGYPAQHAVELPPKLGSEE